MREEAAMQDGELVVRFFGMKDEDSALHIAMKVIQGTYDRLIAVETGILQLTACAQKRSTPDRSSSRAIRTSSCRPKPEEVRRRVR
jgi:hypothetical protein